MNDIKSNNIFEKNKNIPIMQKNEFIKESLIGGNKPIPIDSIVKASKSLCKITKENLISLGFLIKLFKGEQDFYCLITNEHCITREMVKNRDKIIFYYDNETKKKEIYLNTEERFIKDFIDINLDVLIIEILSKDNIEK